MKLIADKKDIRDISFSNTDQGCINPWCGSREEVCRRCLNWSFTFPVRSWPCQTFYLYIIGSHRREKVASQSRHKDFVVCKPVGGVWLNYFVLELVKCEGSTFLSVSPLDDRHCSSHVFSWLPMKLHAVRNIVFPAASVATEQWQFTTLSVPALM